MMSKEKLIQFVRATLPMSVENARKVVKDFVSKEVVKGEFLLKEGEVCNNLCFVEDGLLRSYTHNLEGRDVTTAFYCDNMFANDYLSFFKHVPSKENLQALTDCKMWCISYDDFQRNYNGVQEFREFGRLNFVNSYARLKQIMLSMLHDTAEQRYTNLMNSSPEIVKHTPLKNIASYLGITDTSLSRIRKEFIKKRQISAN